MKSKWIFNHGKLEMGFDIGLCVFKWVQLFSHGIIKQNMLLKEIVTIICFQCPLHLTIWLLELSMSTLNIHIMISI